jgi:hypothetical protein
LNEPPENAKEAPDEKQDRDDDDPKWKPHRVPPLRRSATLAAQSGQN